MIFHVDPSLIVDCSTLPGCSLLWAIVLSALILFTLVTGFAYTTLLERRVISLLRQSVGPNRVGRGGFLQPAADGIKLAFKEDVSPNGADRSVFLLAPLIKTIPTLVVVAVIPLGPPLLIPWFDGL